MSKISHVPFHLLILYFISVNLIQFYYLSEIRKNNISVVDLHVLRVLSEWRVYKRVASRQYWHADTEFTRLPLSGRVTIEMYSGTV
jgi:hypothetical protein